MRSRRGLIALGMGFLASLLLLTSLAPSAGAVDRIYWANGNSLTANRIGFANLNGTGNGGNLTTTGATAGQPRGVTIDSTAGRVFWTNRDVTGSKISYTNLVPGSGAAADLNTAPVVPNGPNGAAIHPGLGRIYWASEFNDTLSYASLGGGGVNLAIGGGAVGTPNTPMVDPGSGSRPARIYWANAAAANEGIYFAGLDGGTGTPLVTPATAAGATVENPHGMAVDPVTNRIYWANPGIVDRDAVPPVEEAAHIISWIDLDTPTQRGNLVVTAAAVNPGTVNRPIGVAIDPDERKIYWANWGDDTLPGEDTLAVADLGDGVATNARRISTTGAAVNGTRSPALLKAPSGTGQPGIDGDTAEGSVLSCSEGNLDWAEDLAASWLYRAPQRFAYSWQHNGDVIEDANGQPYIGETYIAETGGNYSCTVTASNAAGSTISQPSDTITVTDQTPPAAVTGLKATAGDRRVALSWTNPGDLDFDAVRVVRTIGGPASDHTQGVQVYEGKATKVDATGLTNGTAYTFTAFARDGDGNWSDGSTPVTATPKAKPVVKPTPPAGPPATGGSTQPPANPAKPAFGAKTLLRMNVAARRINGNGRVKVIVRNGNRFEVSGRLSGRAGKRASVARTRTFLVGAKGKATVTLKLSKAQKRMLKRDGKLSLRLTATFEDPAGGKRTVKKTVSLRLKAT